MLSSFIIVFREVLEAALVIGVLFAATKGLCGRGRWIAGGILAGVCGACVVALSTEAISGAIQGMGQEIFNAGILFLAAALITWHVVWMKKSASKMSREIQAIGGAVCEGRSSVWTLGVIAFLAVLREGAEVVLFVYGLSASGQSVSEIAVGSAFGIAAGLLTGVLVYIGMVKIPTRYVFSVTGAVLTFLAAGMMSHSAGYLTAAGILPGIIEPVWNSSPILAEKSALGSVLHALVGYVESPSLLQIIVYSLTLGSIMFLQKLFGNAKKTLGVILILVTAGLLGSTAQAFAAEKVYAPYVNMGEVEVEYKGSVTFDDRAGKDDKQKNQLGVGYGVLEKWFFEVYGAWENPPGAEDNGTKYAATEIENRIQLTEQGEYFADFGFQVENEFAAASGDQDELRLILLVEKDWDLWRHRVNPYMEYKYGGRDEEGETPEGEWEAGVSWSTTYRAHEAFEPGFEIHWAYENVKESLSFNEQEFQIGPVAYGKIGPNIKYDVGYLFGVSEGSPDGELKWIVEFEKRF